MPNIVTIKNNEVVSVIFSIDADIAVLDNAAQVGDIYDPDTGTFSTPVITPIETNPLNEYGE